MENNREVRLTRAGDSYSYPIWYKRYRIYRNDFRAHPKWAEVSWLYQHDDYDPTPQHSYDGPSDYRAGACSSIEACKQEIDWLEEDEANGNEE